MFISSKTLELALARILRVRVTGAHRPFPFSEIRADWPATGLRASDLRDVMHELMERGLLRVAEEDRSLCFELTERGADELLGDEAQMVPGAAGLAFENANLSAANERAQQPLAGLRRPRRRSDREDYRAAV